MAGKLKTMPTSPLSVALQHLLADLRPDGDGMTDGELLARFLGSRDEDALAALVRRHASMVWGVCRRLLHHHDAEDAFQATFLVLVRKATNVPKQAVANWLYGVARQTAIRLRATAAKRGRRETQVVNMPEPTVPEVRDADLQVAVDEELSRLPDHYRSVIVLCDLEGMTRKEAARQLGIPEGSVASRLARARALLAKRLALRGVVFSGSSVAALVSAGSASASAPPALVASTIKAASLLAAGQAAGFVSVEVAALTEGVVKAMFVTKIKAALVVILILGFVATILSCRTAAGQVDKKPATEKPVEPAVKQDKDKDKEIVTAWGQEVGGLQAGLGFRPGERRAYHLGETVKLVLRVRNVGKEEATISFRNVWPSVIYGDGGTVTLKARTRLGLTPWKKMTLLPGKEIELQELKFELKPASEGKSGFEALFGTGTFRITYEPSLDGGKDALNTGKLELEVKEPEKKQEKQTEAFTAWGKEVDGLQAGLCFPPGQQRAYHYGETPTLVVRLRNVGKEEVKFQYLKEFFFENPLMVTDVDGKTMPQGGAIYGGPGAKHLPVEMSLAPGKEIEFAYTQFRLAQAGRPYMGLGACPPIHVGTGKVSVQFERVFGNTSRGRIKVDPDLLKLATGKLELKTKPAPAEKK